MLICNRGCIFERKGVLVKLETRPDEVIVCVQSNEAMKPWVVVLQEILKAILCLSTELHADIEGLWADCINYRGQDHSPGTRHIIVDPLEEGEEYTHYHFLCPACLTLSKLHKYANYAHSTQN